MKLLVTTNGRLYENGGKYFTPLVYSYSFFDRYLSYFDEVRLVAHVEKVNDNAVKGMLRVDGAHLEVYPVDFPHGKLGYIKHYNTIKKQLQKSYDGCDAAILRIPDQLAFQVMPILQKANIPVGIEVTTNSWDLFAKGTTSSFLRPVLRVLWDIQQKNACKKADASSYVTSWSLQKRYPPSSKAFTTNYSSVDVRKFIKSERDYGTQPIKSIKCMHVSGSIGGTGKGHGELLKAMALLEEKGITTKTILVGGGNLSEANEQFVKEKNLDVEKKGVLNSTEIAETMQNADIFVFPSYREGLPRVVIEAMATGMVCVTTRLDGITELLEDSVMVPVGNAEKLADVIYNLLQNPEEMTLHSKKNFLRACDYTPEKMAQNRTAFYNYLSERISKNG